MMTRTLLLAVFLIVVSNSANGQLRFDTAGGDKSESQIERILEQKRDMVFKDATLEDVVSFLIASGIAAYIDRRALDDVGLSADEPIFMRQYAIRLRDGLTLALRPLDLSWTVRRGRLIITTPEAEEMELLTRVYDVRHLVDLIPVHNWGGLYGSEVVSTSYYYDYDALLRVITSTIAPSTWVEVGGAGSIEPYHTRRMRILIVSQTYDVHNKLSEFLDVLAKHGGTKPLSPPVFRPSPARVKNAFAGTSGRAIPNYTRIRSSQLRTTGQ
jgi:hypothetical protein